MPNDMTNFGVSFSVFDATTDELLDTNPVFGQGISIVATPEGETGSAVFRLNGDFVRTENVIPYAIFGNSGDDYFGGDFEPGEYELEVEFFSEIGGQGTSLGAQSFDFTVSELGPILEPLPDPETEDPDTGPDTEPDTGFSASFTLVDTSTNEILQTTLSEGETVAAGPISIVAQPSQNVGSASFSVNGQFIRTENVEPYALFGDNSGDFFDGALNTGENTLEVVFTSGTGGTGDVVGRETLTFTVGDTTTDPIPDPDPDPDIDPDPDPDPMPLPDPDLSLAGAADRILFHFDGNNNDPDDIAAMASASLMTAAAGIEAKTTFFYGNNLSESNAGGNRLANLEASADFAETLGIDTRGYQDDLPESVEETTEYFVDLLETGEKILSLEGGPMEAIYRALERVDPSLHSNITLVSHDRSFNENRSVGSTPFADNPRTWSDISDDFPDVTLIQIDNQNRGNANDQGFYSFYWNALDDAEEPVLQAARAAMEGAGGSKKNDASDSGMLWFALTGEEDGDPRDALAFFEASGLYDQPYPAEGSDALLI